MNTDELFLETYNEILRIYLNWQVNKREFIEELQQLIDNKSG